MLTIPWASRWCAGYARSQGISSHGTGIPYLQYSGHSMKTIFMQYVYNRFMTPTFKRLRVICSIMFNILRPRQNGRCFLNDTFKHIFLNENVRILIKISLKFVPEGPINNNPALVQIMAWRPSGDKPLSEPMMVSLLTHICITRPQWVHIKKMHDELQMKLPTTPVACTYYNTWHISSEVCFVQYCFRYISTYHRVLVFDLKIFLSHKMLETRTTRAPAFSVRIPSAASWLPIPLSHIGSQVKRRQSQSYNFKECAKISRNGSDEYCWRYRADTILSTDGQMDRQTRWNQYTPLSTSLKQRV